MTISRASNASFNPGAAVQDSPSKVTIGTATNVGTARAFGNAAADITFTRGILGGVPDHYTVTSSPGNFTTTGTSSPLRVQNLIGGTAYTFTVVAYDANNVPSVVSDPTTSIVVSTKPNAPVFSTPTPVISALGYATGAIDVPLSCSSGGSPVTSYTVTTTPGSITATGTSPVRVTGLTGGTSYTFAATATNANGTSSSTSYATVTSPITVPQAPTIGTITNIGPLVTIPFTAGANGGAAITSYSLSYSYNGDVPRYWEVPRSGVITATSSPILFIAFRMGVSYTFTLTAKNSQGSSLPSAPVIKAI